MPELLVIISPDCCHTCVHDTHIYIHILAVVTYVYIHIHQIPFMVFVQRIQAIRLALQQKFQSLSVQCKPVCFRLPDGQRVERLLPTNVTGRVSAYLFFTGKFEIIRSNI